MPTVTELLMQVIHTATELIIDKAAGPYWLQEDIRWVEREIRHIHAFLKDAEMRQSVDKQVGYLVTAIRKLAEDTKAIFEKFGTQTIHPICFICSWWTLHSFSMEIRKIKRRAANIEFVSNRFYISDVIRDSAQGDRSSSDMEMIRTTVEGISSLMSNRSVTDSGDASEGDTLDLDSRQSMLHVAEPYVVGFDNELETLKAKLLNQSLRFEVVSIVGIGGLGKTTLAKKLYNSAQHHFECSAKVTVSQRPKIKEILHDIAKQVGLETTMIEGNLEANLYAYLSDRNHLLFLDDLWRTEAWDALKIVIPNTSQRGSRIILTSRDNGVAGNIGGIESLHWLRPLDFVNSWKLFSKTVMDPFDKVPPELEDVGRQIVLRCGGLPLAIVLVAGMIREKERLIDEWKGVLECMYEEEDPLLRIMTLSYIDLPPLLKPCFLFLGLFPEDHEINAFQLINIWVAQGFIQANTGHLVEDIGERYLNKLVSRNLIQVVDRNFDGKVISCRIQDLLHRLCILIGRDNNFFNTLDDLGTTPVQVLRRVTTHYLGIREYLPLISTPIPMLSAFLCFDSNQEIKIEDLRCLLPHLKFLKILVIKFSRYLSPEIPDEIGDLSLLSFFQFTGHCLARNQRGETVGSKLPHTISKLKNLLTLDVRCSNLSLPSTIWDLQKIRHLLLTQFAEFFYPSGQEEHQHSNVEQSLQSSEPSSTDMLTLDMIHADHFNPASLYKFSNLRRLGIYYPQNYSPSCNQIIQVLSNDSEPVLLHLEHLELQSSIEALNELISTLNLSRCEKLRELIINAYIETLPQLPLNLSKLTLSSVFLRDDPLKTLGSLPVLKILQLSSAYGHEIQRSYARSDSFPELEVLEIHASNHLAELAEHARAMPKLKKLVISKCNNLKVNSRRLQHLMTN